MKKKVWTEQNNQKAEECVNANHCYHFYSREEITLRRACDFQLWASCNSSQNLFAAICFKNIIFFPFKCRTPLTSSVAQVLLNVLFKYWLVFVSVCWYVTKREREREERDNRERGEREIQGLGVTNNNKLFALKCFEVISRTRTSE